MKKQIVNTVRSIAAALLAIAFLGTASFAQETKEEYFGKQVAALTAKIAAAPDDDKLYTARASAYFELQKYARATADIDKALGINPKNSEALEFQKKLLTAAYSDRTGTVAAQYQEDLKSIEAEAAAKNSAGKTSSAQKTGANNSTAASINQTNEFSPADVDEFNKQNPNVGQSTAASTDKSATGAKQSSTSVEESLHLKIGFAQYRSGFFDIALGKAKEALQLNPENSDAIFLSGLAKGGAKDFDGAIADFSQVINVSPNRASAGYFQRGQIYKMKNDLNKALADYDKAAELDPKAAEAAGKARARVAAKMNKAEVPTSTALGAVSSQMEERVAELKKLNQYQVKLLALQEEAQPLVDKLVATKADDYDNQQRNRAALRPKMVKVRDYLIEAIAELREYKSEAGQKMHKEFIGVFGSVIELISKL